MTHENFEHHLTDLDKLVQLGGDYNLAELHVRRLLDNRPASEQGGPHQIRTLIARSFKLYNRGLNVNSLMHTEWVLSLYLSVMMRNTKIHEL